jgi:hypothetical protein
MALVVVCDRNVELETTLPAEDDPPLLVDPDAPSALQITPQWLKPIAWRHREILQLPSLINHPQLPASPMLDIAR